MDGLVDALVPGMPPPARAVTGQAQGIPLFAVETVRALIDRDIVAAGRGGVPPGRRHRGAGRPGQPARAAGRPAGRPGPGGAAAGRRRRGAGRHFPAEALIAVSGLDETAVRAALAELLRREVLSVSADPLSPERGSYRFAQRCCARSPTTPCPAATARPATWPWPRTCAPPSRDGEEVADVIARHYLDALTTGPEDSDADDIRDQAVRIGVRAADRANRAGAPATAGDLFAMAAGLAEQGGGDPVEAAGWWENAADAARLDANIDVCLSRAERARGLSTPRRVAIVTRLVRWRLLEAC